MLIPNRLVSLLLLIGYSLIAQIGSIPIGTWRAHTSYIESNVVEVSDSKIWCGTSGGLFYIDSDDQSINTLTKKDGMVGLDVTALKYTKSRDLLFVGYKDGNINLIQHGKISSIQDIVKSNVSGLKKINHISIFKKYALLSCDFGAILFDMDKLEIKESYLNIGINGKSLQINSSTTKGDSIFLATSEGVYAAKYGSKNLIDFKNWTRLIIDTLTTKNVSSIEFLENKLFIGLDKIGVFSNQTGVWKKVISISRNLKSMSVLGKQLLVSAQDTIIKISENDISFITQDKISEVKSVKFGSQGNIWWASYGQGLVKSDGNQRTSFIPNGPFYNQVFNFYHYKNIMLGVSGGFDDIGGGNSKFKGYYEFAGNNWTNFVPGQRIGYIADATSAAFSAFRNTLFIGTQNEGVMGVNQTNGNITFINDKTPGCKLTIAAPISLPDYINIRALGVTHDDNTGDLWICNSLGSYDNFPTIHKYKADNTCNSYIFPFDAGKFPQQLVIDNSGNKWVRLRNSTGGGILVFNEKTMINDGITPNYVYLLESNSNIASNNVRSLAKDLTGNIWVGTTKGISVFYNPNSALNKIAAASAPIYQNRPLLFDQEITCIEVDGGNRKWIGTTNGLYLFNADGTEVVYYFNKENSLMFSNNIIAVKSDPITGEVFVSTDINIVSYRESATRGLDETPVEMNIFPNPVSVNYDGFIGFSGLATDAMVKIVDVTGNLVYQTKANGGMASWNGRDYNGKKVGAGVYVVLSSKNDGTNGFAGKLFVTE